MKITRIVMLGLVVSLSSGCSEDSATEEGAGPTIAPSPTVATEQDGGTVVRRTGEEIYNLQCKACHDSGPGHPATLLLAEKYGEEKAVIKGREDLTVDYIKSIVRNGLLEMPPFRPTEITDAELDTIAAYIKKAGD